MYVITRNLKTRRDATRLCPVTPDEPSLTEVLFVSPVTAPSVRVGNIRFHSYHHRRGQSGITIGLETILRSRTCYLDDWSTETVLTRLTLIATSHIRAIHLEEHRGVNAEVNIYGGPISGPSCPVVELIDGREGITHHLFAE